MSDSQALPSSNDSQGLPWSRIDWLNVALIVLGGIAVTWQFWQPGIASNNDMLTAIYRTFALDQSWAIGLFYPRMGMELNFAYGSPLFQYYPPLVSYLTLIFYWLGLGLVEATKTLLVLALLLAGSGAYVYGRWLLESRRAALLTAIAFSISPYLLCNIYERGAVSETLALALLPWLFWTSHHLLRDGDRHWLWASAGLIALLMLAHNITTLFALPALMAYLIWMAWQSRARRRQAWRRLLPIGLSAILGLGVSAFYWLPALAERGYTWIEATMLGKSTNPTEQLLTLGELVQPYLAYDYWGPDRFRLALWAAILGGIAILGLVFHTKKLRHPLGFMAGALFVFLFLQLTICRPFWQDVPLVRFIQFPWRLYGLGSFFIALLIGSMLCWKRLSYRAGRIIMILLAAVMIGGSMYNLSPAKSGGWFDFSSEQANETDLLERGRWGHPIYTDYIPKWVTEEFTEISLPDPMRSDTLPKLEAVPNIQVIEERPTRLELSVQAGLPFTLRLHRFYFPGWQVYLDGEAVPTDASGSLGLVTAELPAGEYTVVARFGETPLRRVANVLSIISLVGWIAGASLSKQGRKMILGTGLVAVLFVTLGVIRHGANDLPRQPTAYHANFQDEIHLVGYDIDQTTLHAGDTLSLHLYWLAQVAPLQDYKVFLHLAKQDDSGLVAQGDGVPVMGYSPTTRWEPGELIVDEHQIRLSEDTPPGTYLLLIGVYREDEMTNLSVLQAPQVLPGDRIILTPIEVE